MPLRNSLILVLLSRAACVHPETLSCPGGKEGCVASEKGASLEEKLQKDLEADPKAEQNLALLQTGVGRTANALRSRLKARAKAETKYGTMIELNLAEAYGSFRRVTEIPADEDPTNPGKTFDEFMGFLGMNSELTDNELKLYKERFIDMVFMEEEKDHLFDIKDPEKRIAWYMEEAAMAFEYEKPAVSQKQVEVINSDPLSTWQASIKTELQNVSQDMFHHMLGLGDDEANETATDVDPEPERVRILPEPKGDAEQAEEQEDTSEEQEEDEADDGDEEEEKEEDEEKEAEEKENEVDEEDGEEKEFEKQALEAFQQTADEDSNATLSSYFDSRTHWSYCKNVIGKVHNQGTCGSCWAFSAAGVTDSRLCIKSQGKFTGQVSRGFITSCEGQHSSKNGNGCKGGWPRRAFELVQDTGVPTGGSSGCVPYFGDGNPLHHFSANSAAPTCPQKCENSNLGSLVDDLFHLQGYGKYIQFAWHHYKLSDVKNEMYKHGPVSAIIYCSSAFMSYTSGRYDGGGCTGSYPTHAPNHAVVAIGWKPSSMILINSWGKNWGQGGTFEILNCGVASYEAPGSFSSPGRPGAWDASAHSSTTRRRRTAAPRRRSSTPRRRRTTIQDVRRRRSAGGLQMCDMNKHGGTVRYWQGHSCSKGCPAKLPSGHAITCCYSGLCASFSEKASEKAPVQKCDVKIPGSSCNYSPCSYWYTGPAKCVKEGWTGYACHCPKGYCANKKGCVMSR